jgi:hypothetical protein
MSTPGQAHPGAPPRGTAGDVWIGDQAVHVNAAGIIDTPGPYYGKYPTEVQPTPRAPGEEYPGAPPRGTAGYVTVNGLRLHVNEAGIVDTRGSFYGKYPTEIAPKPGAGGRRRPGPSGAVDRAKRRAGEQPGRSPEEQQRENDDAARQRDARARIGSVLAEYGLESMADWVWQQILDGKSDTEVLQDLRNTPEFKKRFPAIEERRAKGLNAISPGEYVAYERQARQLFRAAGLPGGFYDSNDDFTRYIAGDMSLAELNDRIGLARRASFEVDPEVRATLSRDYGISDGDLTAWFLDDKVAQPLLEKRFAAGEIGAAAVRSGFGRTSRGENESLAGLGINPEQAQEGFGTLAGLRELTVGLPGQREAAISRDEQIGAAFRSDAKARAKIETRRSQRQATFRGGGGFASDRDGMSGLGQAERT